MQNLLPLLADTAAITEEAIRGKKRVLFEGAQGTLLDVDHGTYPFVTSSNPIASGASTGMGIGPTRIDRVLGVAKAYVTRVGEGPLPSEIQGENQQRVQELGGEFGTVTGRVRRCGWLDLVALRYAVRVNGITSLALTKLDVLDGMDEIKVCVGYEVDGKRIERFPFTMGAQAKLKPIYETFDGWSESTQGARSFAELPATCIKYVRRVEELVGCPVALLSTSPQREDTILMTDPFRD